MCGSERRLTTPVAQAFAGQLAKQQRRIVGVEMLAAAGDVVESEAIDSGWTSSVTASVRAPRDGLDA